ncbi:hypothetical protein, partial [Mesorhizobium sp. M1A.F.Ca.IN.020.03.2.1]|uniref:hypothetical protein n=1 Tax=Mesorhizobium sp. M1A.F.Ca.IN.020.03.2.1 TaxID=2496769 RepID=UPI0019D4CC4F
IRGAESRVAGAVEMAEIVLLGAHANRMGRIAALIKPADLPYTACRPTGRHQHGSLAWSRVTKFAY